MIDDTPRHPFEILRPMDYSKHVETKSHGKFDADYLSWAVCWSRLWYNEDIRDLDYRKETLVTGQETAKGKITVDQNVKLDRLSRDPVFNGSGMSTQVKEFIASIPTEQQAKEKIEKLKDIIKKEKVNG